MLLGLISTLPSNQRAAINAASAEPKWKSRKDRLDRRAMLMCAAVADYRKDGKSVSAATKELRQKLQNYVASADYTTHKKKPPKIEDISAERFRLYEIVRLGEGKVLAYWTIFEIVSSPINRLG